MDLRPYSKKQISVIMDYYGRERSVRFWGEDQLITPCLIKEEQGDGMQVVYLQPLDTRPNYYVLRIDSSIDIDIHTFFDEETKEEIDVCEMLLKMVKSEQLYFDAFEELEVGGETMYRMEEEDDLMSWDEVYFPTLHWSGGSWGASCDVSHILNK